MTAGDGIPVDLHDDGLLWLINAAVLHPRGFALGHTPGDPAGDPAGDLVLQGDGSEPWRYASSADVEARGGDPTKAVDVDRRFEAVEAMFNRARVANAPGE